MSPKILNKHYLDAFFIDMNITSGRTKFPLRHLIEKREEMQKYIASNIYYNRDFNENHRYNYLRDKINERKKMS